MTKRKTKMNYHAPMATSATTVASTEQLERRAKMLQVANETSKVGGLMGAAILAAHRAWLDYEELEEPELGTPQHTRFRKADDRLSKVDEAATLMLLRTPALNRAEQAAKGRFLKELDVGSDIFGSEHTGDLLIEAMIAAAEQSSTSDAASPTSSEPLLTFKVDNLESDINHLNELIDQITDLVIDCDGYVRPDGSRNKELDRISALTWIARDLSQQTVKSAETVASEVAQVRHLVSKLENTAA